MSLQAKPEIVIQYHKAPYGELMLGAFEGSLCLCDWRYRKMRAAIDLRISTLLGAAFVEGSHQVLDTARVQLQEYFQKEREVFDLPLLAVGTEFQKSVWQVLREVPYGAVSTYKELSEKLGRASAIRAVASANGANALSIFIPCHRIIGSDGKLVGYAGGLPAKRRLLELESPSLFQSLL